jgi:hypothetical protein
MYFPKTKMLIFNKEHGKHIQPYVEDEKNYNRIVPESPSNSPNLMLQMKKQIF